MKKYLWSAILPPLTIALLLAGPGQSGRMLVAQSLGNLSGQVSGKTDGRITPMTGKVPRMADRKPNFEGVWAYGTVTPIERPAQFAGKRFMNDAEAEQILTQSVANRRAQQAAQLGVPEFVEPDRPFVTIDGRKPTSIIFDPPNGQIPYIAPNVPQWPIPNRFDGPEDIPLSEKCQRALEVVPIFPSTGLLYMQIVQSHDYVAFTHESLHTARIVPLDGRPHISEEIRTWYGDTRGRWEGDTLVVESTNFRDQLNQRARRSRFDRNLRVVERFSMVTSETLWYEFTVEDPTLFSAPWSGAFSMRKTNERIFEDACHEGNYATGNILRGARVQEGAAAEK
jgi:hypothetical protein